MMKVYEVIVWNYDEWVIGRFTNRRAAFNCLRHEFRLFKAKYKNNAEYSKSKALKSKQIVGIEIKTENLNYSIEIVELEISDSFTSIC